MDPLNRLYIEVTTACNFGCAMCVQRVWEEPVGHMPPETFRRLMAGLADFPAPPVIHLGGYGEPMAHPHFFDLVQAAKATGARLEMTTNGSYLDRAAIDALLDLGLDRLVVSVDGASPAVYQSVRAYDQFEALLANLHYLYGRKLRRGGRFDSPRVGIAFVAMKRNIHDLPALARLAPRIGVSEIIVSNLVPHSPEMADEVLYQHALTACAYRDSAYTPSLSLPKLDMNGHSTEPLRAAFNGVAQINLLDTDLSASNDYCRFVQEGYAVVRWDGQVHPCLPLMHDHPEYLHGKRRQVQHYSLGDINQEALAAIWRSPEYSAFRRRLRDFPFSPCTTCGSCEMFLGNAIDCQDNTFPTCGACLWAQGFVQCP